MHIWFNFQKWDVEGHKFWDLLATTFFMLLSSCCNFWYFTVHVFNYR